MVDGLLYGYREWVGSSLDVVGVVVFHALLSVYSHVNDDY